MTLQAIVIFASLVGAISLAASNTGSGDPRCPADFDPLQSCPSSMILPGGAGFDTTRNIDPTSCNDQENCPRCLGDDAWQQKMIDEIGLYSAVRDASFKPWVMVDNWLSHEIISTITMLLLRDAMNISARAAALYTDGTVNYICCLDFMFNMEQWNVGTYLDDSTEYTVTSSPIGYQGQSALFIPPYTAAKYPLSVTYQAYKYLDNYKSIFPPSFSTACSNMTVDDTKGCVSGNYVCETNAWANTTCYDGQWYVPPQCNVAGEVGNSSTTHCQEVWMADPTYDSGYFEGMIKNNGLNMTGAYLGVARHNAKVREAVARKEDILFYWYYPDPLIAEIGARVVNFDPVTLDCTALRNADPTLNRAMCGYPVTTLQKRTRKSNLAVNADFKSFFEGFTLSQSQVDSLLAEHTSAGGNYSVYNLSCNWLKNNYNTWRNFVKNTPSSGTVVVTPSEGKSLSTGVLVTLIVVPTLFVCLAAGVAVWVGCRHREAVKNAPQNPPLALIFTDIESSTMLWEACGGDMGVAVEIHHAIIRKHIEEYGAYEVKTIGDSFMIACGSLGDATMLCLAIQTSLGECETLPSSLRFAQGGGSKRNSTSTATLDFHYPLRVRIGLHWCQDVAAQRDRINGRYDYYGHDVNVCARVEAQAQGGQILVTAETMKAIMKTDMYDLMIAPDTISAVVKRNVELRGISECVTLYALAPTTQVESGYITAKHIEELPSLVIGGNSSLGSPRSHEHAEMTSTSASVRSGGYNNIFFGIHQKSGLGANEMEDYRDMFTQFTAALFRASFKAVPESGKGAWLKVIAKRLRVVLITDSAPMPDTSNDRQIRRKEQFKHFEQLTRALEECCHRAHAAESMDSHGIDESSQSTLGIRSVLSEQTSR